MNATRTHSVPALERALTILELLAQSRNGRSLSEISERLELPRSSVHCLLLTLQRKGYLHRNERTSRYMFGLKLLDLASNALNGLQIREQAGPHLAGLVRQTQLTAHLAILEQKEAVLVSKHDPPGVFRLATWIGKRMELHCTGVGKALLAYMPEQDLSQLVRDRGLPRHNENTISSVRKLREDLACVVRRGYAIDDEEDEIGLRCIGAPVFDQNKQVIAAISIAGTTLQLNIDNLPTMAKHVKDTGFAISRVLGFGEADQRTSESAPSTRTQLPLT